VAAAGPGHVVAVSAVVAGAAPPAARIVVLLIVGRMCASAVDAANAANAAATNEAAVYGVEHSTVRVGAIRQDRKGVWRFFLPPPPPPPSWFGLVLFQLLPVL
jgi:hypothetical protein